MTNHPTVHPHSTDLNGRGQRAWLTSKNIRAIAEPLGESLEHFQSKYKHRDHNQLNLLSLSPSQWEVGISYCCNVMLASSSVLNGTMHTTGPNISSVISLLVSETLVMTVGRKK